MKVKQFVTLLGISLLFLLAACSSNEESNKLVVYTPASEEMIQLVIPAFEEETGIQVEVIAAATGELLNRISGEASNPIADVMWGGSPSLITPLADLFEEYVTPNESHVMEEFRNKEGYLTRFSSTSSVILVNTDLIEDVEINGYADLIKPELRGKIAHGDATASSSAYNHLENMLFSIGADNDPFSDEAWEYVSALLQNLDGRIISSSGAIHRGVADGEYAVGLTYEEPAVGYVQDGAPVKVIYPQEGTIFKQSVSAIIKNAKNIENAKKFNDFLLSDFVQSKIGMDTPNRPLRTDAELADYKTPISEINVLDIDDSFAAEIRDDIIEMYMDLLTSN